MTRPSPEVDEYLRNMQLWLAHAERTTGPERDAALRTAAYWSSLAQQQSPRADVPTPAARSHWFRGVIIAVVVFVPVGWLLTKLGLVHLLYYIGHTLVPNR